MESDLHNCKNSDTPEPEAGSSKTLTGSSSQGSGGLFLDLMNNFRELAETQLQCAVCSEVLVEATALSCGHTFCRHCITVWKAKSATCPVCRADIRHMAPCKVMDEYMDKTGNVPDFLLQTLGGAGTNQRYYVSNPSKRSELVFQTANQKNPTYDAYRQV